jgi:acetylornithine deacetylase/succinyl-diaminopimelate desuccinylase family protein
MVSVNPFATAQCRREVVTWLSRLVAARTENPPGNESLACDVVEELVRPWGLAGERHASQPSRDNLILRVGAGRPRLAVALHTDVVPAGDGWGQDPFSAQEKDGRLYGRGASDDKGPLAAMLLVVRELSRSQADLKGQLLLACVADEEVGSAHGVEFLLANGHLQADMAIIPDAASHMEKVMVAEKGALFVQLTSLGTQAHGSRPEKGYNAIWPLLRVLELVRKMPRASLRHDLLSPPTMNLGVVQGGAAPNIVPARATARIDLRYLPGETSADILEAIRGIIAQVREEEREARLALEVLSDLPPTEVARESPLVWAVQHAGQEVLGNMPVVGGMSGATVAKQFIAHGIPAVGFAPGDADAAHTANEYVEIEELIAFAGVMLQVTRRLLGGGAEGGAGG